MTIFEERETLKKTLVQKQKNAKTANCTFRFGKGTLKPLCEMIREEEGKFHGEGSEFAKGLRILRFEAPAAVF